MFHFDTAQAKKPRSLRRQDPANQDNPSTQLSKEATADEISFLLGTSSQFPKPVGAGIPVGEGTVGLVDGLPVGVKVGVAEK